jgi:hypothetical protein
VLFFPKKIQKRLPDLGSVHDAKILKPSREDARKTGVPQVAALNPGQSKHPAQRKKKGS